jgi:hypothetical protein
MNFAQVRLARSSSDNEFICIVVYIKSKALYPQAKHNAARESLRRVMEFLIAVYISSRLRLSLAARD